MPVPDTSSNQMCSCFHVFRIVFMCFYKCVHVFLYIKKMCSCVHHEHTCVQYEHMNTVYLNTSTERTLTILLPAVVVSASVPQPSYTGSASHWRDCHCAASPSPFSRCFNSDGEGGVSKMTEVSPTARHSDAERRLTATSNACRRRVQRDGCRR